MIPPFCRLPPHPVFLNCTWMLLTELCLFTAIRFSTVHAQVSVNINYFYQGLQCAEWLAKRVYCKRQMKMRVQGHMDVEFLKTTWNLGKRHCFTLSIFSFSFVGLSRLLCLALLCTGVKTHFFRCSLWMAKQVIFKTFFFRLKKSQALFRAAF